MYASTLLIGNNNSKDVKEANKNIKNSHRNNLLDLPSIADPFNSRFIYLEGLRQAVTSFKKWSLYNKNVYN